MRKCCCCISVHVGATILGLIGFLICALELAVLVPYLFEIDPEVFNPVQQNLEQFYFVLEKTLTENQIDKDTIDEVLKNLKEYLWPAFLGMFSNFLQIQKKNMFCQVVYRKPMIFENCTLFSQVYACCTTKLFSQLQVCTIY